MRYSVIKTTFMVLASISAALTCASAYSAEEGKLGYPKYVPIDVCPTEIVGYESLGVIDFTDPKTTTDGWTSRPGVKLERGERSLRITSTTEDPYFFSPPLEICIPAEKLEKTTGKTLVKIRVRRENTGSGQIFFASKDNGDYDEKFSTHFELEKDSEWHDYTVPLDVPSMLLRLRFDIGGDEGFAEIERIELVSVRYQGVKFGAHAIDEDGMLEFDLLNSNAAPEIVDTKYYGVHPKKSYPGSSIQIDKRARPDLYFPQKRPFEEIEVVAVTRSTKETLSRRFFAFNEEAADKALEEGVEVPTLKNENVEVRFAPDASGAEIFRGGKRVAAIAPLIAEEGDGAEILPLEIDFSKVDTNAKVERAPIPESRLVPVFRSVDGNSIDFDLVRVPIADARAKLNASAKESTDYDPWTPKEKKAPKKADPVDPAAVCGSLSFRLEGDVLAFDFYAPCKVHAPVVRVLGEMEQAILSGSEYLEKGEHSSSTADIETNEHLRYATPVSWMTAPFAAVATDRGGAALLYDDPKARPIFAVPNFIDGDVSSSRMNVCAKQCSGKLRVAPAAEPIERSILWAVKTMGLPDIPTPPRTGDELAQYLLAGFEKSCLKADGGWRHAVISPNGPDLFAATYGSDFVSTIWEISGKLPDVPTVVFGGGHIPNYAALLLTGNAAVMRDRFANVKQGLTSAQQEDGSYRYSGKYLAGAQYDYASGNCGNHLYELMNAWRFTNDASILPVVKKGLDFVNRLKTPAGAQVWELSLHTPDIMGASRCVLANVWYYEATGEKEYLDAAVRWALTGIPFVYLWEDKDITPGKQPMMRYATIAVFGATNWASPNWMGRPVQWCGLDYAHALIRLAKHDDSLDWKKIAEGIVASAECQLGEDEFVGLLPDSFDLATQKKFPAYINTSAVWFLRRTLDGKHTNAAVVDCSGRRVVSPFPMEVEGNKVKISAVEGMKYQVLIEGQEIRDVASQGVDVLEF